MASGKQIQMVMNRLDEVLVCPMCSTRLRFGDRACPHCEEDTEETLRLWAERLLDDLGQETPAEEGRRD